MSIATSTKATAFWNKKNANYNFQNSAQFVLTGKENDSKHRTLGATSSCGSCGEGGCGIGGCGSGGCDSY